MKIQRTPLIFEGETVALVFSKAEQRALLAASAIAEQARKMIRERCGQEWEDDAADIPLAHVEYDAADLVEGVDLTEWIGALR